MKPLAIAYPSSDMDRTRFSELIRDHHQPLLAYARVLAGHPGRARDLGQDAFVAAWPLTGDALALDQTGADFQFATAAALFGMKLRGMEEVNGTPWEKVLELAKPGLADDASEDRAEVVELVRKLSGSREGIAPAPAEIAPENRR